jgi:hypothetical protein
LLACVDKRSSSSSAALWNLRTLRWRNYFK